MSSMPVHLQHWKKKRDEFLDSILTVDESFVHPFDLKLKHQMLCAVTHLTTQNYCTAQPGRSIRDVHYAIYMSEDCV